MVTSRLTQETYFIERFETSEAAVMRFVDIDQPLSLQTLLVLFVRGLYAPSPLRVLHNSHVGTLIEAITMAAWYLVFSFAVVGFWAERHRPAVAALWVMLVAVLAVATMGEAIGADSYRHRMVGVGIACTLAGYGWNRNVYRRHPWPLRLWWLGAVLFTGAWLSLQA
jgi:predicted acyltransferase